MRSFMMIETINDLIEAYGGASALGEKLGITQEAVSMWRARGEIPGGWHMELFVDGRSRGWEMAPSVFGFHDPDSAQKFLQATRQRCVA
jgi:hypothetical protein